MKKSLFTIIVLVLLASCSVKTNEEKARDLIESFLKNSLYSHYHYNPEQYTHAKIKLDSCFRDHKKINPEKLKFAIKAASLYKEYKNYILEAKKYQASRPKDMLSNYWCAHGEAILAANKKANEIEKKIIELIQKNIYLFDDSFYTNHEFIGWVGIYGKINIYTLNFDERSSYLFFTDKDLKKIEYVFSGNDFELLGSVNYEHFKYDFGINLREVLSELYDFYTDETR